MNLALLGMPNCGKSTLFHLLTGVRVPTGNRPGVTVSVTSAPIRKLEATLFDLPGIRNIPTTSADEAETFRFLRESPPDLLLAVLDATRPKEPFNLFQKILKTLPKPPPLLLVFNCCDELSRFPSAPELSKATGVQSVAISARTGQGLPNLLDAIQQQKKCHSCNSCPQQLSGIDLFSNPSIQNRLFSLLGAVSPEKAMFSDRMDRIFLHPWSGIPLFFLLTVSVLWLSFGPLGTFLTECFCMAFLSPLSGFLKIQLESGPPWLSSLVLGGIIDGVGAVLSFLPRIGILFLFQSLMEQSGLLSRIAKLFDPFFIHFGLRGDAVTPLLLGFGCTVPAISCTRSLKDPCAASRCAVCLPAVACSARMPLCLLLCDCFFQGCSWLICLGVWLFSGFCFLIFAWIHAKLSRAKPPIRHEDPLPRWRLPSATDILAHVLEELRYFLLRAAGTIFLCSLLIWLLSHFSPGIAGLVPMEVSLLSKIGAVLCPVFQPLGFGDWRISVALLCGLGAKEAALSTLGILFGVGDGTLAQSLLASGILTPASALSLIVFYTLYFPCLATVSALHAEKKRMRWLLLPLLFAWILSFFTYRIMGLFI